MRLSEERYTAFADTLLDIRSMRDLHLDDSVSTDGPFTILMTLFRHRETTEGVPIGVVLSTTDSLISTGLYLLDRLIDWGHVIASGPPDHRRYRLSTNMEQNFERYVADCLDRLAPAVSMATRTVDANPGQS